MPFMIAVKACWIQQKEPWIDVYLKVALDGVIIAGKKVSITKN